MALLFIALAVFYQFFVSDAFTCQFLYNHLNLKRNHHNGGPFFKNRLPIHGLDTQRRGQISCAAVVEGDEVSIKNPVTLQPIATEAQSATKIRRILGSQELLMLPRQYRPNETNVTFPPVIHVSVVTLNKTPSIAHFFTALQNVLKSHPLLSCRVAGDGEPASRIDLLKMVRRGNPNPETFVLDNFQSTDLGKVVIISNNAGKKSLVDSWSKSFQYNLDLASFDVSRGPLWSLEIHKLGNNSSASDQPCALLFVFNHAISDQRSVNMLIDHFIAEIASLEEELKENQHQAVKNPIPMSMEECTLGGQTFSRIGLSTSLFSLDTLIYVSQKAAEGLKNTPILPDKFMRDESDHTAIDNVRPTGESQMMRHSMVEHRTLPKNVTTAILEKCRQGGVTFSNVLTAAMAFTSSDFISGTTTVDGDLMTKPKKSRTYKVLQSLDLRRFGIRPDPCETIGCHAGSHDLLLGPIPDFSGSYFRSSIGSKHRKASERFWNLAKHSRDQTKNFIESGGPVNAVRVFDLAMSISDMNNLVHLAARSRSQGRAYSAGVTNAGVYERQFAVRREGDKQRSFVKSKHGRYEIEDIFFAGGHGQSGSLYHVSVLTVNEELKLTFHPVSPIVNRETSKLFADAFVDLLKVVSLESDSLHAEDIEPKPSNSNFFPIAASVACLYAIGIHWDAWLQFFSSLATMKENTNPNDFWDALNFWIFFAVAHPILQPALWISEILHGSPGPYVADLIPLNFLLANVAFIAAMIISKSLRNTMNIVAFSALLAYVGAGLDGQAGVEDYNLQLNDSYENKEVKGCPSYRDVRQPSMDGFDLMKYQGMWFEHAFHDWTQFKEVSDTTLNIKLTSDGTGWIDDFGVKGPAPKAAKLSWDKSPVANGAHYFLFGRVDKDDPVGVLREKGFNVEFPNYIVDVQKNPVTGEYTEAIQFQCLERGGVRVFEGINFLSRSPEMTNEQLTLMHQRASKAGIDPYGASVDQMHIVERRPVGAPNVDNSWQKMWRAIGVDKLLELLAESIEDGGRN